jgi:hypothetical protein
LLQEASFLSEHKEIDSSHGLQGEDIGIMAIQIVGILPHHCMAITTKKLVTLIFITVKTSHLT